MKRVVLFGAPGSGKGTQTPILADYFDSPAVSLGDILREEVKRGSTLGCQVKDYMERGLLVPDELVAQVIDSNIEAGGFILDGYPRNLAQAQKLEEILAAKGASVDVFIYFEIDQATAIERLSQRRVCRGCGALYHLVNMPPKRSDICDACGSQLYQRKDDDPKTIAKRWEVFLKENKGLLDFYTTRDKLITIDGRGNKDDVFVRIKSKLQ